MPHPNVTGQKSEAAEQEKVLLSIEEYMEMYGEGRTTVYHLLNRGELEAVKSGRRTLITRRSADARVDRLPRYTPARAA